jgi:regulator of sirC expression with transglutaminase-like and TPR domain
MKGKGNIEALIKLLDDPDVGIYDTVSGNLVDMGKDVIPELESVWESTLDTKLQERIEQIIDLIEFNNTKAGFRNWLLNGAIDIVEGAFHVAKFQYPDLSYTEITRTINEIKKDVWLEINDNLTALEKVRVLNHFIYDVYKLSKNSSNYYSPQNSYINQVLETKKGNAILLAIIYMGVAKELEIPIYGVNLPKNFILAYKDLKNDRIYLTEYDRILFYINPFNNGAVLGRKEIDNFLNQIKVEPNPSFYLPCSNFDIIKRILQNLIYSYEMLGYADKINKLFEMVEIIEGYKKGANLY